MDINYEQVYEYRKVFFKWTQISKMLNVDINHLYRWRIKVNFRELFSHLFDEEVNEIMVMQTKWFLKISLNTPSI